MTSFGLSTKAAIVVATIALAPSARAQETGDIPSWLAAHVGEAEGRISAVVLHRARALYLRKLRAGKVGNPCYFAMDATRPADVGGKPGRRFYTICEEQRIFNAISSGHGGGRSLPGLADFANGRRCAKHFGDAENSELTTGGAYVTAEVKTSFKGYRRVGAQDVAFTRAFVQFDGEGDTASARRRAIGGHAAQVLRGVCMRKAPGDPHANDKGEVVVGKLVDYAAGRSNGCTSWSASDARDIVGNLNGDPSTVYIYPESRDIQALAQGGDVYWNAACLREIGAPRYWSAAALEPLIARYAQEHPAPPPRPLPACPD